MCTRMVVATGPNRLRFPPSEGVRIEGGRGPLAQCQKSCRRCCVALYWFQTLLHWFLTLAAFAETASFRYAFGDRTHST